MTGAADHPTPAGDGGALTEAVVCRHCGDPIRRAESTSGWIHDHNRNRCQMEPYGTTAEPELSDEYLPGPSCSVCGHLVGVHSHESGCMDFSVVDSFLGRDNLGFCRCTVTSLALIRARDADHAALLAEVTDALDRVRALADEWDAWDGTRPHPGESSRRQRRQLRAALDGTAPAPDRDGRES